ncbi:LysR family transcriptional regulator, partial [Escherichia coli]
MRMNMSDFATFFAVARNQSFRAAGDELGLSSSAISHSIKTLEQRLKIRLFNRTTRSVSLTEAGSNLYERLGNDSNLLIVFYVQIMPDDFVMQLHR